MALPECIVASPPKTGSTILTRMLCQHPDLAAAHETYLTMPDFEDSIANPDSRKPRWHDMPTTRVNDVREAVRGKNYGAALALVAEHMRHRTGARLALESWPFWGPYLPLLRKVCPDALKVIMVRDPRALWWSSFSYPREDKTEREREQIADGQLGVQDETAEILDGTEHVLRLEDFVEDPEREVRRIWQRLGLDPDEGWHAYRSDRDPLPDRWSWIPGATSNPDPRRVHAWRREMPVAQQRVVGDPRAQMMAAWGYDAGSSRVQQHVIEHFIQGGSLEGCAEAEHEVREGFNEVMCDLASFADEAEASQKALVSDEHEYDRLDPDPYWRGHAHGFALGKDTACASMRHPLLRAQARAHGEKFGLRATVSRFTEAAGDAVRAAAKTAKESVREWIRRIRS